MFNYMNDLIAKEYSCSSNSILCDYVIRKIYRSNVVVLTVGCGTATESTISDKGNNVFPIGTAHLLEHLIMSNHLLVNRIIEKHGVILNAVTTYNKTYFTASGFEDVHNFMEDFLTLIFNPNILQKTIDTEKDIVRRELETQVSAKGNSYYKVLYKVLVQMMFNDEFLSYDVIGDSESINTITKQHLIELFKSRYHRNNIATSFFFIQNEDMNFLLRYIQNHLPVQSCVYPEIEKSKNTFERNLILDKKENDKCSHFIMGIKDYRENIHLKDYLLKQIIIMRLFSPLSSLITKAFNSKLINNNHQYKIQEFKRTYNVIFFAESVNPLVLREYVKREVFELAEKGIDEKELRNIKEQIIIKLLHIMETPINYCKFNSDLMLKNGNLNIYMKHLSGISLEEINREMKGFITAENIYTIIR